MKEQPRLLVLTPPELAPGFALAGAETLEAASAAEAEARVRELVEQGVHGVVAIHAPFWNELPAALRTRLETSLAPVAVPVPAGLRPEPPEARRARLATLLQRAVGYHIVFEREEK